MNRRFRIALALTLPLAACGPDAPDSGDPLGPVPQYAKPPWAGGGDGGGDGDASDTWVLSGGYVGEDDTPEVQRGGRTLTVDSGDQSRMPVVLDLPAITTDDLDGGTCVQSGFASSAEAVAYWDDLRTDASEIPWNVRAQVDLKALEKPSVKHFSQMHRNAEAGEAGAPQMRAGNHELYGPATYTKNGSTESYTLTGGGVGFNTLDSVTGAATQSVSCDFDVLLGRDGSEHALTFELVSSS